MPIKAVIAVQAGIQEEYTVDSKSISIRKWTFSDQDEIKDAAVVGLELKNTYDHFLAASTYGGYDTWYRSIPPMNNLILTTGVSPYIGFHYALEGGTTPPLQDVARAVANKIKSALPGWLGGSTETGPTNTEPSIRAEQLSMRTGVYDPQRTGSTVVISPDRRLAAFTDNLGRVAVLDIIKGHLIRLFKGCRDAQCAFVQIFDGENKKPQLSTIKDIRRAIFLIIYNPRKGLIDIRLMQRGSRVAVFTASKNGKLLYNTCGLVGAEKNFSHKKLNLPEFQCAFIDPDGKIKKFNIPFYHSLDGEHLERSKDLHVLRAIREIVKKSSSLSDENRAELYESATKLKTLGTKKHCIEILIKNCSSIEITTACLELFWESLNERTLNQYEEKVRRYFGNLALITNFYCLLNNEPIEGINNLISDVCAAFQIDRAAEEGDVIKKDLKFQLLEDDTCILERLLILAQEKDYKQQQVRVKFADNRVTSYREFISCFHLEGNSKHISLKPDLNTEKANSLSVDIFKSLLKLNDMTLLPNYVKNSNVDARELVKLVIMHLMSMSLDEININLIEKFIAMLYYICSSSEEAVNTSYNEVSPWWESIRSMLIELHCPLRSMIVAMSCKAAAKLFEGKHFDREDAWETLTQESASWGLLIGKLEDISILSIILLCKEKFQGQALPKLQIDEININLKYIYARGQGSVTELIAKWLCGMGVPPEAVVVNELMEVYTESTLETDDADSVDCLFIENNRFLVDDNVQIFKWLSLLRRQFPLSTKASYVIANMCWEYAMEWQKSMNKTEMLATVVICLDALADPHLKLGMFSIIWSTYLKQSFEASCKLVNKVGKLPKDQLCLQDLNINTDCLIGLLKIICEYLNKFLECLPSAATHEKTVIRFENLWDESSPSLVEVAQNTKNVDPDILTLNYQISCTIYYQCHFNLKVTKPLDTLYDIDYEYILEALTGTVAKRDINLKCSEKIRNPRMKYLTKLTRTAIDTISCDDDGGYDSGECLLWVDRVCALADLWDIDINFVRRQNVIGLYHMGYDELAENMLGLIADPEVLLTPLLAITIQRLKRSLENSKNQAEWIVSVPPQLYKRLQNTALDNSIPANPSLSTTALVLGKLLAQIAKKPTDTSTIQDVKLCEMIVENCEMLSRRKL
ncbi:rab3 GTPase-activating protein regulatory subunit isoform X2 [Aricia agestis]|uniref:rab3 GTPase-activating protein regulatory subunit isoform X2 n=1 Tax=Aricia agestis TaxID=91739 RepID=UPI001C2096EE|nr:rab3 GTPase-activating protein regulatory subunit isoform X2 [Aricia agestis]